MLDPPASHYAGIREGIKERKKKERKRKNDRIKKKETGASVVECLVDRNYYSFGFYNVQ